MPGFIWARLREHLGRKDLVGTVGPYPPGPVLPYLNYPPSISPTPPTSLEIPGSTDFGGEFEGSCQERATVNPGHNVQANPIEEPFHRECF